MAALPIAARLCLKAEDERLAAAVVYGEASTGVIFEEMAGIAAVLVPQAEARGSTVLDFLNSPEADGFTRVLTDGNAKFRVFQQGRQR